MKSLFEIGSFAGNENAILCLEIGESFISLSIVDETEKAIKAIRIYTFNLVEIEPSLQEVFHYIDTQGTKFKKVIISPAFPEALLVPRKYFKEDAELLQATYQVNECIYLSDVIGEWQLINSYAVSLPLYKALQQKFTGAVFMHAYTPLLKIFNGFTSDYQIAVYFVHNQFRLIVKSDQQVQLVQTYSYTSPMDVVYYLLKIFTEFGFTQELTQVIISGFVEENSALYKELHNYFLNLHFANTPFLSLPDEEHSKHYFTSINNLAACVL